MYIELTVTIPIYEGFQEGLEVLENLGMINILDEEEYELAEIAMGVLRRVDDHVRGILRNPDTGEIISGGEEE